MKISVIWHFVHALNMESAFKEYKIFVLFYLKE